jgi:hypothetical protein
MKSLLLIYLIGALGALSAVGQIAVIPGHATASSPPGSLTPMEWQELRAAHQAALRENPALATKAIALAQKMRAFQSKLHAAMIQANPSIAPVVAKLQGSPSGLRVSTQKESPPATH